MKKQQINEAIKMIITSRYFISEHIKSLDNKTKKAAIYYDVEHNSLEASYEPMSLDNMNLLGWEYLGNL